MSANRKIIRPKLVSEIVLEQLRTDIISGKFALGEKISEGALAELYGVTKAPIRAAYLRLQTEGLIDIWPQSGTYVFKPSQEDLRALCEMRIALELEAARLSLLRGQAQLQKELEGICQQMETALKKGNQERYLQLDTSLHMSFFDIARSPYLFDTYETRVSNAFAALRQRFAQDHSHNLKSIDEHVEILKCIKSNNFSALSDVLRRHITNTENYYEKLL